MCLKPRQIVDNLNRDSIYNTYNEELDQCDYIDYCDPVKVNDNDLPILQLNIRGLYSKLSQLKELLNDITWGKKPDLVLVCETWQNKNNPLLSLPGYDYVFKTRTHKLGGGVGIFISNRLRYKHRRDLEQNLTTFEHCIIEIELKNQKLIVGSGYRAPGNSQVQFLNEYGALLENMSNCSIPILIGMDHNLDLLKENKHNPTKLFTEKKSRFQYVTLCY